MREYLRELRVSLNLSQQLVADQLGVTRQYYQQIECGDRQADMGVTLAKKLANVFDVPVEKIIEEEAKISQESA